ncbi:CbtA family protein [Allorhizocola rhizosphaerae]|uniref:CbtA family protein n=1 Tax=Allorhizocola rhizosphaerae TaxID=1872709 RepID=UPI000E3DFEF6|nr:CbtA family protein [Allorhizocola rhizosphaerae]
MSLLSLVGRGGLAGACAGLASGLVSLLMGGPLLDRAIALEDSHGGDEVFSRDTQQVGLLVAAVLIGVSLGLIFGVLYWYLHKKDLLKDPWGRSMRLAGAGFLGVSLLPFLRFPANPPGIGDADTVDTRNAVWLAAVVISVAAIALAWRIAAPGQPVRQLAAAGVVVAGLALLFALPGSVDVDGFPAGLLWSFRLVSLLTLALTWAGIGAGFGLAAVRQAQRIAVTATA